MSKSRRPPQGTRTWAAWVKAEEILADGEWHWLRELLEEMMWAGGIQRKTAYNLIGEAVGWGVVERGGYKLGAPRGGYIDRRKVRLVPKDDAPRDDQNPTRRVGQTLKPASPGADQAPRDTAILDRIRQEIEDERNRFCPPPPPNENVNDRGPVDPNKTYTPEEAAAHVARAKRSRRPPGEPTYMG
jgi:hypothetical protein